MCVTPDWIILYDSDSVESKRQVFLLLKSMTEKKISQTPNKYITSLNYADKILLVFPGGSSGASLC